jgi:hypothetical protein
MTDLAVRSGSTLTIAVDQPSMLLGQHQASSLPSFSLASIPIASPSSAPVSSSPTPLTSTCHRDHSAHSDTDLARPAPAP